VRSVLPQYLQRTKWVLDKVDKPQLIERTKAALSGHPLPAPEAGSLSFMLSKQGNLGDKAGGPWQPHVMFFVPHGHAASWGAGLNLSPVLGGESSELDFNVLFIPVAHWSDGSPAALSSTEVRIGDSVVMISDGGGLREPAPAFLYVYVEDTDSTYRRAIAANAVSIEEPADMPYGDRRATVRDEWGNTWQIATHKHDL